MRQLNRTRAYLAGALGFATHALFALAPYLWWSAYHHRPLSWLLVASAVFVGNLPDADTTSSYIGRLLWPLAPPSSAAGATAPSPTPCSPPPPSPWPPTPRTPSSSASAH